MGRGAYGGYAGFRVLYAGRGESTGISSHLVGSFSSMVGFGILEWKRFRMDRRSGTSSKSLATGLGVGCTWRDVGSRVHSDLLRR